MGMRRNARRHETVAAAKQGVHSEEWWEHKPGARVVTVDGPGHVTAVHEGPYPGNESYEVELDGGLGGGTYGAGQVTAASPVQASVGNAEGSVVHTADQDYPELGTLLHDRPDPAKLRYTASLEKQAVTSALGGEVDGEPQGIGHGVSGFEPAALHSQPNDEHDFSLASLHEEPEEHHQLELTKGHGHWDPDTEQNLCAVAHDGPCTTFPIDDGEHEGHTASLHRLSMPSKYRPEHPKGFSSKIHYGGYSSSNITGYLDGDQVGNINYTAFDENGHSMDPSHDPSKVHHLKVNMLETTGGRGRGVASALMDHLYEKHPNALINHGYRTSDGLRWWRSYNEPDPSRNVHNLPPHEWDHVFDRSSVAEDINRNEENDPGHHSDEHDVDWATGGYYGDHDYCEHCDDYAGHSTREHEEEYGNPNEKDKEDKEEPEEEHDPDPRHAELHRGMAINLPPQVHRAVHDPSVPTDQRAQHLLDYIGRGNMPAGKWNKSIFHAGIQGEQEARDLEHIRNGTFQHNPPTRVFLHAAPFKHDEVHDEDEDPIFETNDTHTYAKFNDKIKPVNFHLKGISWTEHNDDTGPTIFGAHHAFAKPEPVGMQLAQDMQPNPERGRSVGPSPYSHNDITDRQHMRREHEERYRTPERSTNPPGTGEQMKLFARQSSLPSLFQVTAAEHYTDYDDPHRVYLRFGDWPDDERSQNNVTGFKEEGVSTYDLDKHGEPVDPDAGMDRYHLHDHNCEPDCDLDQWNEEYGNDTGEEMRGRVHRAEQNRYNGRDLDGDTGHLVKGKFVGLGHDAEPLLQNVRRVGDWIDHRHLFVPGAEPHRLARDEDDEDYEPPEESPSHHIAMLAMAATDTEFRFHVTAAWSDVRAKAKRIRSQGGVQITHATDAMIVGNVKGDHHVYETGLQRYPGKRQSVATYSCGCKWGAYHWGAPDDMSRFAGRMCSHALALQYEAASRGMFGRDVEVDDLKPRWVPSKVVVKYDIDTGQNLRAKSSRQSPEQSPLIVALALMSDDDPAVQVITAAVNDLFGDATGYSEPELIQPQGPTSPWNREENPGASGPLTAAEPNNWGRIGGASMFPRIAQAIGKEAFWQQMIPLFRQMGPSMSGNIQMGGDGAEATLHDEPEGALPTTDGEDHEASLGDVNLTGGGGIGSTMRPEDKYTASLGDVDKTEGTDVASADGDELNPDDVSIQTHGSAQDIVAEFQRSAAAQSLMAGGGHKSSDGMDLAAAAEAFLAKTAKTNQFTRAEQEELINESPGVQASNTDRLDLEGTHYAELEKMTADHEGDDLLWMM